jgi:hypothetical protein
MMHSSLSSSAKKMLPIADRHLVPQARFHTEPSKESLKTKRQPAIRNGRSVNADAGERRIGSRSNHQNQPPGFGCGDISAGSKMLESALCGELTTSFPREEWTYHQRINVGSHKAVHRPELRVSTMGSFSLKLVFKTNGRPRAVARTALIRS